MLHFLKNASLSGPVKFLKDIDLEHEKLQKGKKILFWETAFIGKENFSLNMFKEGCILRHKIFRG